MAEAHVSGFANRLGRAIVTVDEREAALMLTEYQPDYAVPTQLSMRQAKVRRESEERPPVWLLMSIGHFSALLPNSTPLPPACAPDSPA